MALIITGMATGRERSSGTINDRETGEKVPWEKDVLVLLEGTRTREVRLDKGWTGNVPQSGTFVAVECVFGYGNKLHGVRVLPESVLKALEAVAPVPA